MINFLKDNKRLSSVAFLVSSVFLIGLMFATKTSAQQTSENLNTVGKAELASLSRSESSVRNAAVKVISPYGSHGSGTYVNINGFDIILTASHVVDELGIYTIKAGEEEVSGIVVYRDQDFDIAAILIDGIEGKSPMAFKPVKGVANVGDNTVYSGYPSQHSLLTFRGMVVGHASHGEAGGSIIVHTFGWFGCSGSGVYNEKGGLVGILWGVDAQASPYGTQIIEDVLWIAPASEIDVDQIMSGVCNIKLGSKECSRYFKNSEN